MNSDMSLPRRSLPGDRTKPPLVTPGVAPDVGSWCWLLELPPGVGSWDDVCTTMATVACVLKQRNTNYISHLPLHHEPTPVLKTSPTGFDAGPATFMFLSCSDICSYKKLLPNCV
jgi:hypothetical protein